MKLLTIFSLAAWLLCGTARSAEIWTWGATRESGWYDVNKNWSGDTLLCWAATASNLLNWWNDNLGGDIPRPSNGT